MITKNQIKNIVFDLGGVLISWDPAAIVAAAFEDESIRQVILKEVFAHEDWRAFDTGALSEEEAIQIFSRRTDVSPAGIRHLLATYLQSLHPIPQTVALLKDLSRDGVALFCLSNVNRNAFNHIRKRCDFMNLFQGIVISGQIGIAKPDPRIFHHLLKEFSLSPEETVLVDDRIENVQMARDLGITGIHFVTAKECREKIVALTVSIGCY